MANDNTPETTTVKMANDNTPEATSVKLTDHECANCELPGTIFCPDCASEYKDANGNIIVYKEWYCSAECLKKHRSQHEYFCERIADDTVFQQAERAGEVAQALFYIFMEKSWNFDIGDYKFSKDMYGNLTAVDVIAGKGVKEGPGGESTNARIGGGWLVTFKIPGLRGKEDGRVRIQATRAVLAEGNSRWALVFMERIIRGLFEPLCKNVNEDIKEIQHTMDGKIKRKVNWLDDKGEPLRRKDRFLHDDEQHGVYEIDLKSGEKIALDLAGEQYLTDQHKPVMHWKQYWIRYGTKMRERCMFGDNKKVHRELLRLNAKMFSYQNIHWYLVEKLDAWIRDPAHHPEFTLQTLTTNDDPHLFALQKDSFETRMRMLLESMVNAIDAGTAYTDQPIPKSGLRHPRWAKKSGFFSEHSGRELILADFGPGGPVKNIRWEVFKKTAEDPKKEYKLRKRANDLLKHRCVYTPWGNHKVVWLKDSLPPKEIAESWVTVNPYWDPMNQGSGAFNRLQGLVEIIQAMDAARGRQSGTK